MWVNTNEEQAHLQGKHDVFKDMTAANLATLYIYERVKPGNPDILIFSSQGVCNYTQVINGEDFYKFWHSSFING